MIMKTTFKTGQRIRFRDEAKEDAKYMVSDFGPFIITQIRDAEFSGKPNHHQEIQANGLAGWWNGWWFELCS